MSKMAIQRNCVIRVDVGDGATMSVTDRSSYREDGPQWIMRYGNPEGIRYEIASLIESYDYLVGSEISLKEATRRLRILRKALATKANAAVLLPTSAIESAQDEPVPAIRDIPIPAMPALEQNQ